MNGTRERAADLEDSLAMLTETLEDLLRASGDPADQKYMAIRDKATDTLAEIRARMAKASDTMYYQTKKAVYRTDDYVHQKPWQGIGVGASVGLIVGLLLARR